MDVTIELWETLDVRQYEVRKRVRNGGLSIEDALAGTQGILDKLYPIPPAFQPPSWYVQPQRQIERVADFVERYNGGLSSLMTMPIPPVPTDFVPRTPTEVLMLMVYLPDKGKTKGLQRTFDGLWDFVTPAVHSTKWRWESLKSDSKHLRLVPGIEYRPGIRWVAFDPNTNQGKSPKSCWGDPNVTPTLAGPEVLMALALFPKWAASWDGNKSPTPKLAGYQFKWEGAWQRCPNVNRWGDDDHQLMRLNAFGAVIDDGRWSCPSVREC